LEADRDLTPEIRKDEHGKPGLTPRLTFEAKGPPAGELRIGRSDLGIGRMGNSTIAKSLRRAIEGQYKNTPNVAYVGVTIALVAKP